MFVSGSVFGFLSSFQLTEGVTHSTSPCPSMFLQVVNGGICAMVKSRVFMGMGDLPPLMTGILIMGKKTQRTWVDEFIPYYMEIMGVDRPWHICLPFTFRSSRDKIPSLKLTANAP